MTFVDGRGRVFSMPPAKSPKPKAASLGPLTRWTLREHLRFTGGKRVIDHFRDIDANADGDLSKKEFCVAVKKMGFIDATQDELDAVWDAFDVDKSGTIPYKECAPTTAQPKHEVCMH